MVRRIGLLIALLIAAALPASAQSNGEGLNLPADLYVLLNNGQIQRYGVGTTGVVNLTPAGLFIVDFGVDSVGDKIAFRTQDGLYTIDVASGGNPQQLEGKTADVPPYRGEGDTIAWSPNGDAIAYTTTYGGRVTFNTTPATFIDLKQSPFKGLNWSPGGSFLAAEADQNVWWIYRRAGDNLALSSVITSSIGMAWVSDSQLVFAPEDGGLRLMSLDQANAQALLLDESVIYRLPELDSNNALVFFGRDPNDPNVPDGYGRLLRLARGAQHLETIGKVPVSLNGLLWAPGGSLLVAFQGGVIALYDPSTGLGFPLPMTDVVAYAWGTPQAGTPSQAATPATPVANPTALPATATPLPAPTTDTGTTPAATEPSAGQASLLPISTVNALRLSADSFFLAPGANGVVQVWRMRAGGIPPQPFTISDDDVNEFAVSPDGSTVAYVVDAELWLQQTNQQPEMLARINSFAPVEATFSHDSKQIAYIDERSGVWLDVIADNAPQLLRATTDGGEAYHRPQFSPDAKLLLLDVYSSAGTAIGVLDLTSHDLNESTPVGTDDPRPVHTGWLRDGGIYTYVDASSPSSVAPGIYLLDPTTAGVPSTKSIPLPPNLTIRANIEAVSGMLRLLTATGSDTFAPLSVTDYDLSTGKSKPVLDIGSIIAPQFAPDGRFIGGYQSLTQIDGIQQGALLIADLANARNYVISNPATAWGFRWSAP